MKNQFKSRGHFCNYCRKIIFMKLRSKNYSFININEVIWYGWDHPEVREDIIKAIIDLDAEVSNKEFNNQLRALKTKYGFDEKQAANDKERKTNYERKNKS